jgi:hypothetical protein
MILRSYFSFVRVLFRSAFGSHFDQIRASCDYSCPIVRHFSPVTSMLYFVGLEVCSSGGCCNAPLYNLSRGHYCSCMQQHTAHIVE